MHWPGFNVGSFLCAANFADGTIDVFNGNFMPTTVRGQRYLQ